MVNLNRNDSFGAWFVDKPGSYKATDKVDVTCMCGTQRGVIAHALTGGRSRSCGCTAHLLNRNNRNNEKNPFHGPLLTHFREIKILFGAIARCKPDGHAAYGKKGIRVSEEWVNDPWSFIRYMGTAPSINHSLDRIDGNKGYEPGNCRWATKVEQSNNRRDNVFVTVNGSKMPIKQAIERTGKSYYVLYTHRVINTEH